jgi:hypothetical protein
MWTSGNFYNEMKKNKIPKKFSNDLKKKQSKKFSDTFFKDFFNSYEKK